MQDSIIMTSGFKRVPAVDKCFEIMDLFTRLKRPLGVSEISKTLDLNKSTVFNIIHTLDDLGVLEKVAGNKFQFGARLYFLGRAAGHTSELIGTVHTYLDEINRETKLSAFLGIRSGLTAVIIDKVDSAFDIKIHSEIGMKIPLLAGAAGRAFLSQMGEAEIDEILARNKLKKFTPNTCINKKKIKVMVKRTRRDGIAIDMEEYVEGIRAFAIPLNMGRANTQVALWAVGLKGQINDETIPIYSKYLLRIAKEIEIRMTSVLG
jgi:IclR family KDG regulon transcriptional repressor